MRKALTCHDVWWPSGYNCRSHGNVANVLNVCTRYSLLDQCTWTNDLASFSSPDVNYYGLVMMASSNGHIFGVTDLLCGDFTGPRWIPLTKPVTRNFDVFFDLCPNKQLSKQTRRWSFETPSRPLWRHCNGRPAFRNTWVQGIVFWLTATCHYVIHC